MSDLTLKVACDYCGATRRCARTRGGLTRRRPRAKVVCWLRDG